MIKTWTIAILITALALSGSGNYYVSKSYDSIIAKYGVAMDELMVVVTEQNRDIDTYILNERMLLDEVGGLADALDYVLDQCTEVPVEDTL